MDDIGEQVDKAFKEFGYDSQLHITKQICPCGQHLLILVEVSLELLKTNEVGVILKPLDSSGPL